MINFDAFKKLDLRVAEIIQAEDVEKSEKLLKLKVNVGVEEKQIIAGIKNFYQPIDLIGKKIIVLVNLEPKILFGLESQAMVLVADGALLQPDKDVPSGSEVS